MKIELGRILDTRTKKVAAIAACATLVLSLGALTAFATGIIPSGGFLVKSDNGNVSHSEDGGATWTEGTPDNYHVEYGADGSALSWVGDEKPNLEGAFAVKNENGNTLYSTDGGATWSDTAPEGYEQTVNPDGSVSVKNEIANHAAPAEASLVKNENGIVSHSTDGGETWTEGAPSNYHVEHNEDGSALSWVGDERPEPGDDSFSVKNENGKTEYSTDGGATWSETIPDGYELTENPDGSVIVKKK